jgi:hypothetical protein
LLSQTLPFTLCSSYNFPKVLRALLLFGIMDSDSNERLTQKEFSHVCQKMNEKDMYFFELCPVLFACV